jgi:hypothetical protein
MSNPDVPQANPAALYSAIASATYATVGADIPISPPCRWIRVGATGTLVIQYANGVQDTITDLLAGEVLHVQAAKIVDSGTTVSKVTIFW